MNSLLSVARGAGIRARSVAVLSDHATTVVSFEGTEVVGRVYKSIDGERHDTGREVLERERSLGLHLVKAGVPTARPVEDLDVLPVDDTWVSFWHLEHFEHDEVVSGEQLAESFVVLENALASYPFELPVMPAWNSAGKKAGRAAAASPDERLQNLARRFDEVDEDLKTVTTSAAHGDSHPGNLMKTARGWIWMDLADAGLMPEHWDLATVVTRSVVLDSHHEESRAFLNTYNSLGGRPVRSADISLSLMARCLQETLICWDMGDDDAFVERRIERMTQALQEWEATVAGLLQQR